MKQKYHMNIRVTYITFAVIAVTIFGGVIGKGAWHEYKLAQKADESIKALLYRRYESRVYDKCNECKCGRNNGFEGTLEYGYTL